MNRPCRVERCRHDAHLPHTFCVDHLDASSRNRCEVFGCMSWLLAPGRCFTHTSRRARQAAYKTKAEVAAQTSRLHATFQGSEEAAYGACVLGTKESFGSLSAGSRSRRTS